MSYTRTTKSCSQDDAFPAGYQDFDVVHHYILSNDPNVQLRVRRRGRNGTVSTFPTIPADTLPTKRDMGVHGDDAVARQDE